MPFNIDRAQYSTCFNYITTPVLHQVYSNYTSAGRLLQPRTGVFTATTGLPVYIKLIIFERKVYPYFIRIFIRTGTLIDIQAYLSHFLSLCMLSLTCYLLLVGLTALEGFPQDGRNQSLSYTGVVYTVRLTTLGLVLGAQLI